MMWLVAFAGVCAGVFTLLVCAVLAFAAFLVTLFSGGQE